MSMYGILVILSIPIIYRRFYEVGKEDISSLIKSESLPSIAFIVPVYNMKEAAIETVYNLIHASYPAKEIILVNDGSTDNTLDLIVKEFQMVETINVVPSKLKTKPVRKYYFSGINVNVRLVDKENGGKNDANNVGINVATSEFFLVIDGDTLLEGDALLRMIRPFFADRNTVAQGGTLRVLNGCKTVGSKLTSVELPKTIIEGIQVTEYLRAFLYGRLGWNSLGGNLIVSGAFGLFERKTALAVGGYDIGSIGEDFEMTVKISKHQRELTGKKSIDFIPDPVAWTYVPNTWKWIGKQRARWHQGLFEVLWKYKTMIFNPRYRLTGLVAIPYMWLGELLEPIVEILGYGLIILGLIFGVFGFERIFLLILISWGYAAIFTVISVTLEITTFRRYNKVSQIAKMVMYAFVENIGFRQISLWWRMKGFFRYFLRKKDW